MLDAVVAGVDDGVTAMNVDRKQSIRVSYVRFYVCPSYVYDSVRYCFLG